MMNMPRLFLAGALLLALGIPAMAQGDYSPTVSGDFEIGSLDPDGDNVFQFGNINIPAGVTIRLRGSKLRNRPVIWVATGNVTIAGTLDLSGEAAPVVDTTTPASLVASRVLPDPGPGGYTGGLGARGGVAAEVGAGPGGGAPATSTSCGSSAGYGGPGSFLFPGVGAASGRGAPGPTYGSYLAIPLYGGSGGSGGTAATGATGGTGGAGGGALRIVAGNTITVTGTIRANGGSATSPTGPTAGCQSGEGSGGTIHLVAPTITGNGSLQAQSGNSLGFGFASNGLIRFNVTNDNFTGSPAAGTGQGNRVVGPYFVPPTNDSLAEPLIRITQVNGVAVPLNPQGRFLAPDVVINASTPVTVNIAAQNVALTAAVRLRVFSETAADQLIDCNALTGTVASSTTTCTATFPFSVSISSLRATW